MTSAMNESPPSRHAKPWAMIVVLVLFIGAGAMVVLALRPTGPTVAAAGTGPRSADEALNAVIALKRDGEHAKAEAILKQAVIEFPGVQRLHVEYAEVLAAMNKAEESLAHYERALEIGPRDGAIEFAAGTAAAMTGNHTRAEMHYAAAQAVDTSDWKAPLFLAQIQLKQSTPEKTQEAKKNLLIAANLNPDSAMPWGTLAEIALRENKAGIALQHVRKARELEPRVTLWRVIEARALKRENRPEEALGVLIGLDEAQRREPGVMQTMAECYGALGRPKDAAAMYAKASDSDISNGPWAMEAALWLDRAGEPRRAIIYAARAAGEEIPGAAELLARLRSTDEK